MDLDGFFTPEPYKDPRDLLRKLAAPFAHVERQMESLRRLTEPFPGLEQTIRQTLSIEVPSRLTVDIESMWHQRREMEAGSRLAVEV